MDPEMWAGAGAIAAAFVGSGLADSAITGVTPGPDEAAGVVAGLGVGAAAYAYSPEYRKEMVGGGMLYAGKSAAEYFGFAEPVMTLGEGM